ncbi:MAG: FG-GAP repeat protein [Planctomycetes bacterium]|nr:FG-GAP repeat protein [Planctomycetota bacterium]
MLIAQRDGDNAGDNLGSALAPAGNLNTNAPIQDLTPTRPDVLVGAPGMNGGYGDFFAFSVDPNQPVTAAFRTIYRYSTQPNVPLPTAARFGSSIAGGRCIADSLDPDRIPDAVVGVPHNGVSPWLTQVFMIVNRKTSVTATSIPAPTDIDNNQFGYSVAFVDRATGTNYPNADLVVGSASANTTTAYVDAQNGAAYLYSLDAVAGPGTPTLIMDPFVGRKRADHFGTAVVGSFEPSTAIRRVHIAAPFRDGITPQSGSPGQDADYVDVGRVFTYRTTDLVTPESLVSGTLSGTQFGYSVAGEVDINGDGVVDVLVGAPGTDGPTPTESLPPDGSLNPRGCDEGAVMIYSGVVDGPMGTTPFLQSVRIYGFGPGDTAGKQIHPRFGHAIVPLPAIAPGIRDQFLATAPYYDDPSFPQVTDIGWAALYAVEPLSGAVFNDTQLLRNAAYPAHAQDLFGFAATRIFNLIVEAGTPADPMTTDFAVSAPGYDGPGPAPDQGLVYVYQGTAPDGQNGFRVPAYVIDPQVVGNVSMGAQFGFSLATNIRVGTPSTIYLYVGAPYNSTNGLTANGSVFVFALAPTFETLLGRVDGLQSGEHLGWSVDGTFFLADADAVPDFVAGAPDYSGAFTHQGRAFICSTATPQILATLDNLAMSTPAPAIGSYSPSAEDRFGQTVVGTMNRPITIPGGLRRPQIIIGAPGADLLTQANRGVAFMYAYTNASTPAPGVDRLDRLVTNQADFEHGADDRFAWALAGTGVVPLSGTPPPGQTAQDVLLVGAPFLDAMDDASRMIRQKGRSYAYRFTHRIGGQNP